MNLQVGLQDTRMWCLQDSGKVAHEVRLFVDVSVSGHGYSLPHPAS